MEFKSDLISVIVPVYNTANYLEACLSSITSQSYREIEIIAINDNSTDESLTLLNEIADRDRRIKIVDLDENIGLGPVRNLGIERASGAWVCWIDSDDVMLPGALQQLMSTANAFKSDMIIGQVQIQIDESNGSHRIEPYSTSKLLNFTVANTDLNRCPALININHSCSILYRSEFLRSNGIKFLRRVQEDHDFGLWCILAAQKVSVRGDVTVFNYRKRSADQISANPSITASEWSLPRFEMMVEHFETVVKLLNDPTLTSGLVDKEVIRNKRVSHYVGVFGNSVLAGAFKANKPTELAGLLERLAVAFRTSGLHPGALDADAETLTGRKHLLDGGYYDLVLHLLQTGEWQVLAQLVTTKALSGDAIGELMTAPEASLQRKLLVRQFVYQAPQNNILREKRWAKRLIPETVDNVVVHIGMTKTGSTAIQNFLTKNRALLVDRGVVYPETGVYVDRRPGATRTSGHDQLRAALRQNDDVFRSLFHDEIARQANCKTVIISTENMFHGVSEEDIEKLKHALEGANVKVIAYLRRQDNWLNTFYGEAISGSHQKEQRVFSDFVAHHQRIGSLDYRHLVGRWADVFGVSNILVRSYDEISASHGILSDFLNCAELGAQSDYMPIDETEANRSRLDKNSLALLRQFNSLPFKDKKEGYQPFVREFVEKLASDAPASHSGWFEGRDREHLMAALEPKNRELAENFNCEPSYLFKDLPKDVSMESSPERGGVQLSSEMVDDAFTLYRKWRNAGAPTSASKTTAPAKPKQVTPKAKQPSAPALAPERGQFAMPKRFQRLYPLYLAVLFWVVGPKGRQRALQEPAAFFGNARKPIVKLGKRVFGFSNNSESFR